MIEVNEDFHNEIEGIKKNYLTGEPLRYFLREYLPQVDAKKALGVLHGMIIDREQPDHFIESIFGTLTRREAISIAHHFIKQEEAPGSMYGDASVTESLNYIKLGNDTIRAFYKTLQ